VRTILQPFATLEGFRGHASLTRLHPSLPRIDLLCIAKLQKNGMDRCAEIPLFKPMLIATAPFCHRSSVSQHYGAGVRLNILSRIHRHQHHILARLLMKILTATQWPLMSILSAYTVAAKRRPSEANRYSVFTAFFPAIATRILAPRSADKPVALCFRRTFVYDHPTAAYCMLALFRNIVVVFKRNGRCSQ
jgi:hypothetical protein